MRKKRLLKNNPVEVDHKIRKREVNHQQANYVTMIAAVKEPRNVEVILLIKNPVVETSQETLAETEKGKGKEKETMVEIPAETQAEIGIEKETQAEIETKEIEMKGIEMNETETEGTEMKEIEIMAEIVYAVETIVSEESAELLDVECHKFLCCDF